MSVTVDIFPRLSLKNWAPTVDNVQVVHFIFPAAPAVWDVSRPLLPQGQRTLVPEDHVPPEITSPDRKNESIQWT